MEVGESDSSFRQLIDMGSSDLSSKGAYVGKSQVVSDDDEEIGSRAGGGGHRRLAHPARPNTILWAWDSYEGAR